MTPGLLLIPIFAALNRGRGSRFWDAVPSTVATRLLATGLMAGCAGAALRDIGAFLWAWPSLMLWCSFAWDNYWSAAIGNPTNVFRRACPPVDWAMRKLRLPVVTPFQLRIWGTVAMGLRQSFAAPCIVGLAMLTGHPAHALYALGTLLFGAFYLIGGHLPKRLSVAFAEYAVGAALAALILLATT